MSEVSELAKAGWVLQGFVLAWVLWAFLRCIRDGKAAEEEASRPNEGTKEKRPAVRAAERHKN